MSVNRCTTKCECGLWDFEYFTVQDANELMTPKEYLDKIGSSIISRGIRVTIIRSTMSHQKKTQRRK